MICRFLPTTVYICLSHIWFRLYFLTCLIWQISSLDINFEYLEGVTKGLLCVLEYICFVSLGFLHIWPWLYIYYATKSSCLATSINPFPSSYLPLFYMTFCLMRFHIFPFVSYYFPVQNRSRKLHKHSPHRILAVAHKYLYRLMPNSCGVENDAMKMLCRIS